eukprot:GHVP01035184.1.p1 GENE.GHVP01035184.1~~GHVP01035184.1.p1  ORF type:complete len:240 (+),score=12.88 GHVP01035184.1:1307-2026(+)
MKSPYYDDMTGSSIISKRLFATIRLFSGLYPITLLVLKFFHTQQLKTTLPFYLTNISLLLSGVFFLSIFFYTIRPKKKQGKKKIKSNILKSLYINSFSTQLLITLVYWGFSVLGKTEYAPITQTENMLMILSHLFFPFVFLEFLLNKMIIKRKHTYFSMVFSVIYLLWLFVGTLLHKYNGFWTPYMDSATTPAYHIEKEIPISVLAYLITTSVTYTLHKVKQRFFLNEETGHKSVEYTA